MHAHTRVTSDQFEVRDDLIVHTPTGAECTPHPEREDSVVVWTGEIGRKLSGGAVYQYADVLAAMKVLWRERSKRIEAVAAA